MGVMHSYDPGQVILTLGVSPTPISGYAQGSFIEVDRDANAFTKYTGSDGEVTRVRSRNRSGSIKVILQQGSQSNDYLTSLAELDELSGEGMVPCTLTDMSGGPVKTLAASPYAWIRKKAKSDFPGENSAVREWVIDLGPMAYVVGGN